MDLDQGKQLLGRLAELEAGLRAHRDIYNLAVRQTRNAQQILLKALALAEQSQVQVLPDVSAVLAETSDYVRGLVGEVMDIPSSLRVSPVQVPANPPSGTSPKRRSKRKKRKTVRAKATPSVIPAPAPAEVVGSSASANAGEPPVSNAGQGLPSEGDVAFAKKPKDDRLRISPAALPLIGKTFLVGIVPDTFEGAMDHLNPNWRQEKARMPGGRNKFEEVDLAQLVASGKSPVLGALRAAAEKVAWVAAGVVPEDKVAPQLAKLIEQLQKAHTTDAFIKKAREWAPTNVA